MASELKQETSTRTNNSIADEIFAIAWLAAAVLLALCLFTFNPNDQSLHTASPYSTQNFVGTIGSNVAAILFQFFGLTAYLLPVICLVLAWRTFCGELITASATRILGFALFVGCLAGLLVGFGFSPFADRSFNSGGLTGALLLRLLASGLGNIGAIVVLIALAMCAFLLATNASFAPFVAVFVEISKQARSWIFAQLQAIYEWRARERAAARERMERRQAIRQGLMANDELEPAFATSENVRLPLEEKNEAQAQESFVTRSFKNLGASLGGVFRRLQQPPDWAEEKAEAEFSGLAEEKESELGQPTIEKPQRAKKTEKVSVEPIEEKEETNAAEEIDFEDEDEFRKIPIAPLKTEEPSDFTQELPKKEEAPTTSSGRRLPAPTYNDYKLPASDFLNEPPPHIQHADNDLLEIARQLTEKCKEFKANGQVVNICPGPVVTTYEYKLDSGIKFNQITKLVDDLCLGLKAESVRIDRIPGKAFVGIEVPNPKRETIYLREVIDSRAFRESKSLLTVALGKTVDGLNYAADLAKMPHLLIAGATGAGKSVGVNSLVVSILYKARPDEVKFIMVDPKQVELNLYADIPHLATPIITDPKRAAIALKWAVAEMERRYKELAGWGVRNLDGYNAEVQRRNFIEEFDENGEPWKTLPYIVIIIDEFADLMMVARSEVEESVTRLAQKARAVGVHLVLATQRPSVDVITGLIKANFPSRISFRVSSKIDSRTIIDGSGAEQLLGRGDMLFLPPGTSRLVRVHGAYVDESEIAKIVDWVKEQGAPDYDTTITQSEEESEMLDGDGDVERDELFEQALRICVEMKRASTSVLQRRLRIGYGRAAAILDNMERQGLVGQADGASKPRPVLGKAFEIVADWDLQDNGSI